MIKGHHNASDSVKYVSEICVCQSKDMMTRHHNVSQWFTTDPESA